MTEKPSVLVVDGSEETHEVLETALARHGVRTYHASRARRGLEMAEQIHPDLIVLDLELESSDTEAVHAPFAMRSRHSATPLVLLGSVRRGERDSSLGEFVPKPYDYGPLIRTIEGLLARAHRACRRAA